MPNSRQERKFRRYCGAARFAWNESLAFCEAEYKKRRAEREATSAIMPAWYNLGLLEGLDEKEARALADAENPVPRLHPTQKEQREHLRELRDTNPDYAWLKEIPEAVTKQAIKDLVKAYDKAYKNKRDGVIVSKKRDKKTKQLINPYGFPQFKKRGRCVNSFYQRTDAFRVVDKSHVKLTGIKRPVKVKYRHVPDHVQNPRVTFDGRFWYLSWSESCEVIEQGNDGRVVGIDVGMKRLAVTSDGEVFDIPEKMNPRIQKMRKRKKYLQRRLSRKYETSKNEKGEWPRDKHGHVIKSNNVRKLETKIRKLDRDIANTSRECRQQVVNDIISSRPKTIVIEDLNVRGMFANKHLSKKLQRVGIGEFLSLLAWSCEKHGVELLYADRFYPSTQLCSCCGAQTGPRGFEGLSVRKWTCSVCNAEHDRDLNSSYNLRDIANSASVCWSIKARGASRKMRVVKAKAEAKPRVKREESSRTKVMSESRDLG